MNAIPINWQNIKTVFLDMDGTLLDLHFDNHFWLEYMPKKYAEKHSMTLAKARQELMQSYKNQEGSLKWYCLDHWQESLQMDIISLKHDVAERIAVREHVREFLEFLHGLGKRVVLLTNAHQKTVALKFGYVDLEHYFDRVITSHDIGLAKEQQGFWEGLRQTEQFDPEHSLFIDDNLDVLNTARDYGINYLLAIYQPDSRQAPKDSEGYTAVECYTQLMG